MLPVSVGHPLFQRMGVRVRLRRGRVTQFHTNIVLSQWTRFLLPIVCCMSR
jgi:hypothetical protein